MSETHGSPDNREVEDESRLRDHVAGIIESSDAALAIMRPEIDHLMEVSHKLYKHPRSFFDVARPTLEQMYHEPTYNDVFVYGYDPRANIKAKDEDGIELPIGGDLASRNKGAEFNEAKKYSEEEYMQAIFTSANALGFINDEILHTDDPLRLELGIGDSELQPVGHVDAMVVACAAGLSNPIRIYNGIDDLKQGRVETNLIVLASCDRPVRDDERERLMAKGLPVGKTEFESVVETFNKFAGVALDPSSAEAYPVRLKPGDDGVFMGTKIHGQVIIGGRERTVIAINAPYDPSRVNGRYENDDPEYAKRANTDETFVATLPLLPAGKGTVLIESHDTWTVGQGIVGEQIFGVAGKDVIATGPQKLDRVLIKTDANGTQHHVLSQPESVIDEIAKAYAFRTNTRIKAATALTALES
jgi:hypothetical protein